MAGVWTPRSATAGEDLLWVAAIRDETTQFFRDFDRNVDALQQKSEQTFKKVETGGKQSGAAVGALAGIVGGITMKLLSMGLQAASSFKQVISSAIQVAARAQTLAISLNQVAKNTGYTSEEMAEFEENMKANGITTIKTREALLKMSQAQLDLGKSADIARVAQDAAVIAGTNSSEAFGRIIHGITTLNPLILRHMGIIVNMQEEYKKYARQMGIDNVNAISVNVKQQIAMNAVLTAGERIAGTYTAAMGTAGKQAGSLARHYEELYLAIGQAFQPVYLEWIQFQTESLKEMRQWVMDNKDELMEFGQVMGFLVGKVLDMVSATAKLIAQLPTLLRKLVPIFAILEILPDIDERWENLGTSARQALALVVAGVVTSVTYIKELVATTWAWFEALDKIKFLLLTPVWSRGPDWADDLARAKRELELTALGFETVGIRAAEAGNRTMLAWSEGLGLIESSTAAEALNEIADSMEAIAEETEATVEAIAELNTKIEKEMMELANKRMREEIDNRIREARRWEDLARRNIERIDKIRKDAIERRQEILEDAADDERKLIVDQAEEREDLEKSRAEKLLDIELSYRRRLEDIQRSFEEGAGEAARRNDAVALARLIRQKKRQLKEAKIGRTREEEDEERDYKRDLTSLREQQAEKRKELRKAMAERLKDFEDDLEKRLLEARDARQQDIDNLNRSLAREHEDRARHREWEERDRVEKHKSELQELAAHFATLQFIDESGLRYLLEQHGQFIVDDLTMWDSYYARRQAQQAEAAQAASQLTPYERYVQQWDVEPGESTWGYARGGIGLAMQPQQITIGEREPELVAAIPLSQITSHRFQFEDWNVNFSGVSSQTESELRPVMMDMMQQLAILLRSQVTGGVSR